MDRFHRLILVATCLFALRMAAAEEATFRKPSFCHGLDCPPYTVVEQTADYEARRYAASKWVSTTIDGFHFAKSQQLGFRRLFAYIRGENEDKKEIPMTSPVRSLVTPGEGPFCTAKFTVSFFVPYAYTDTTPKPSAKGVFIEETPEMTVYVASFGGFMREGDLVRRASKLIEELTAKGVKVKTDVYYACGYDSPFRLVGRHNEIWIIGEEDVHVA